MSIFILTVPGDFAQPTPADLTFLQGTTLQCASISIFDDAVLENDELFSVQLTSTDPAVTVSPSARSANITIADDDIPPDVGLQQATYTVGEGSGPLSVCALLNANAERVVVVSLLAISLTAQGRV